MGSFLSVQEEEEDWHEGLIKPVRKFFLENNRAGKKITSKLLNCTVYFHLLLLNSSWKVQAKVNTEDILANEMK